MLRRLSGTCGTRKVSLVLQRRQRQPHFASATTIITLPPTAPRVLPNNHRIFPQEYQRKPFSTLKNNNDTNEIKSPSTPPSHSSELWRLLKTSMKEEEKKEDTKSTEEQAKELFYGLIFVFIFIAFVVLTSDDDTNEMVTEDKCFAKLEADKMPGTVPGCDHIQRVKMNKRIAIEILTAVGIRHAKLEGNLWNCKLKSQSGDSNHNCWYRQQYWNDEAAYQLTPEAAETIRDATEELHAMCLQAVEAVVESDDLMTLFEIPPNMREAVRESWRRRETDFLGRFDLMWDGRGSPKLAEYNADTPTILVETGRGQKMWFDHIQPPGTDWQFNNIEVNLMEAWKRIAAPKEKVYLAGPRSSVEEKDHLQYLKDMADKVDINAVVMDINDIEFSKEGHLFSSVEKTKYELGLSNNFEQVNNNTEGSISNVDTLRLDAGHEDNSSYRIKKLFKLYPYEWLSHEELGQRLFGDDKFALPYESTGTHIVEPAWKLVLGNKAILALLWSMFPNHPNLLPAYFEVTHEQLKEQDYVAKPKYGREGQGILYSRNFKIKEIAETNSLNEVPGNGNSTSSTPETPYGSYAYDSKHPQTYGYAEFIQKTEQSIYVSAIEDNNGNSSHVYLGYPIFQQHFDTARFSNRHIVIGSWVIGGVPAGINFREDSTDTTQDNSCFVPHYIRGTKKAIFEEDVATKVTGKRLNARQRQLYKELYGVEIEDPVGKDGNGSDGSNSSAKHTGGSSGGGGGGFFNFFRSHEKAKEEQKPAGGSTGGHGSSGGGGGGYSGAAGGRESTTNTSTSKTEPSEAAKRAAADHQKTAERFRQKAATRTSSFSTRASGVKATGASHSTVSRAGMGGGRG